MSADFSTEIKMRGSRDDYAALLRLLKYYIIDQQDAYRRGGNVWFFDEEYFFDDIAYETIEDYDEKYNGEFKGLDINEEMVDCFIEQNIIHGELSLSLSGPYGRFGGQIDEIDFFEKLADLIPTCWFCGEIYGSDPGGEQTENAELKDGILTLQFSYREYGDNDPDSWGKIYDPSTKTYQNQ